MKRFNLNFDGYYSDSVRLNMNGACGELFGSTICIDIKENCVETYSVEELDSDE